MEYGGLATIFEKHKYYICDDSEEYADKTIQIIEENKKNDFENIIFNYINIEKWKKKFEEIYKL